jgi:hypothetical protein
MYKMSAILPIIVVGFLLVNPGGPLSSKRVKGRMLMSTGSQTVVQSRPVEGIVNKPPTRFLQLSILSRGKIEIFQTITNYKNIVYPFTSTLKYDCIQ